MHGFFSGLALFCALFGLLYFTTKEPPTQQEYAQTAQQGNAEAQFILGKSYFEGRGVPNDSYAAAAWYRKAAEQGHTRAQVNLGFMYENGWGVAKDYGQALVWYRKAAKQGNAEAQSNLGSSYANGRGVPQDYVAAHLWFNLAAIAGYSDSAKNRDFVARQMTSQQISEAEKLAREWRPDFSEAEKDRVKRFEEERAARLECGLLRRQI